MIHVNALSWKRAIGTALVLSAALASVPSDALAQATPAAAELDIPAPRECEIAPKDTEFFPPAAEPPPVATPAPVVTEPLPPFEHPAGEPADVETVAAVTSTVREALACRNANEFLRAYALFTDDMMRRLFGGPATIDPDIQAVIAESPDPLARPQRVALVAITDVTRLPDGRVGAVVETINAQRPFRDYLIFEIDAGSGRWLIDDATVMRGS